HAAAQSVRMLRAKGVATCFDYALQDGGSFAIVPLIDQYVSDGVLDLGPGTWILLPISQLSCLAKMRQRGGVFSSLLGSESSQLKRADHIPTVRRHCISRFSCGLQCQSLRLCVI